MDLQRTNCLSTYKYQTNDTVGDLHITGSDQDFVDQIL